MIRLILPAHLRVLARIDGEVHVQVEGQPTIAGVLTALETKYPMLRGTIRDQNSKERRPFIRFFAFREDLTLNSPDTPLPEEVARGEEVLRIVGAMAGG
jgi:hypothetical protein